MAPRPSEPKAEPGHIDRRSLNVVLGRARLQCPSHLCVCVVCVCDPVCGRLGPVRVSRSNSLRPSPVSAMRFSLPALTLVLALFSAADGVWAAMDDVGLIGQRAATADGRTTSRTGMLTTAVTMTEALRRRGCRAFRTMSRSSTTDRSTGARAASCWTRSRAAFTRRDGRMRTVRQRCDRLH